MKKRHRRNAGEDLWDWAERHESARVKEMPGDFGDEVVTDDRRPKGMARVWSVFGRKTPDKVLTY